MKQETIEQSREQLEKAFAQLELKKQSSGNRLPAVLFGVGMLLLGMIVGAVGGYKLSGADGVTADAVDTVAVNVMNQITAIDSTAQITVTIDDSVHCYTVTKN